MAWHPKNEKLRQNVSKYNSSYGHVFYVYLSHIIFLTLNDKRVNSTTRVDGF